ncbi:MAG TPA: hypothetical protein VG271_16425 [Beijerinckiaceae bacterium]|nr:hypothetical protein [Beijerinckiaceae bacterium]
MREVVETVGEKIVEMLGSQLLPQVFPVMNRGIGGAGDEIAKDQVDGLDRLKNLLRQHRCHRVVGALSIDDRVVSHSRQSTCDRDASRSQQRHRDQCDLTDQFAGGQNNFLNTKRSSYRFSSSRYLHACVNGDLLGIIDLNQLVFIKYFQLKLDQMPAEKGSQPA